MWVDGLQPGWFRNRAASGLQTKSGVGGNQAVADTINKLADADNDTAT
jgi:hypothetical protein